MKTRRIAILKIALVLVGVGAILWGLWIFSWETTYTSGFSRTRIGAVSWAIVDRPGNLAPEAPASDLVVNGWLLAATLVLSFVGLVIAAHFARQTWLNHGPRDQCGTCGLMQDSGGDDIHCPRCGAWPNDHRSPWACWRLFCTTASPLWRMITGVGRTTIDRTRAAATDNRFARARAEKLELGETCPKCGYDLHRNASPNCPECGYERQYVARA